MEVILLDNMNATAMREAVAIGKGKVKFEASGGVNLRNIRQIAATGVDFVSIGALTHSASRDRFFAGAEACLRLIDWSRPSFSESLGESTRWLPYHRPGVNRFDE